MDKRPALEQVSAPEKDALMVALWVEVERLGSRGAEREAKRHEPVKDARKSRVPPSHTRKANPPTRPPKGTHRGVCLHFVGPAEAWTASPRLAQNASKVSLRLAMRNARTLRKPGGFQRIPARLKRRCMTCLHAPSTAPDPTASPRHQGSWYRMRVRFRST